MSTEQLRHLDSPLAMPSRCRFPAVLKICSVYLLFALDNVLQVSINLHTHLYTLDRKGPSSEVTWSGQWSAGRRLMLHDCFTYSESVECESTRGNRLITLELPVSLMTVRWLPLNTGITLQDTSCTVATTATCGELRSGNGQRADLTFQPSCREPISFRNRSRVISALRAHCSLQFGW